MVASADVFDDLDQFVEAVTVVAGEVHELPRPLDDRAPLRRPRDGDAAAAPELVIVVSVILCRDTPVNRHLCAV